MKYRKFCDDWMVSVLGFGCLRLPTKDGIPMSENIDEYETTKMMRYAIENGVNYFDTAYNYHDGKSEVALGNALKGGYREKVKIATKSPVWKIKEASDFDKYLEEQLNRLQMEHIDFYFFHGLNKDRWENIVLKYGLLSKMQEAQKDGRIGKIGFSFHDEYSVFKQIIDGYNKWDFCQIQYNYMDVKYQAGEKGLKYAGEKNIPVIIMEPLLGGKLANPPQIIRDMIPNNISPVDLALRWIWNNKEVSHLLSGMNSMEQVKANILFAENAEIDSINTEQMMLIEKIREEYSKRISIKCTGCRYCMPCPNNINIPKMFERYNNAMMYGDLNDAKLTYFRNLEEHERASKCVGCRVCEKKCPQKIEISKNMEIISKTFEDK